MEEERRGKNGGEGQREIEIDDVEEDERKRSTGARKVKGARDRGTERGQKL